MRVILTEERERLKREFKYNQVGDFHEGLALVEQDGKWFHILESGEPAYEERFDLAEYFQQGLAWVRLNMNWFRIDRYGKKVIQKSTSAGLTG